MEQSTLESRATPSLQIRCQAVCLIFLTLCLHLSQEVTDSVASRKSYFSLSDRLFHSALGAKGEKAAGGRWNVLGHGGLGGRGDGVPGPSALKPSALCLVRVSAPSNWKRPVKDPKWPKSAALVRADVKKRVVDQGVLWSLTPCMLIPEVGFLGPVTPVDSQHPAHS